MKAAGIQNYGTAFRSQNFADVAIAAGIHGWRVDTPEQVSPALSEAIAHPGPTLIDVAIANTGGSHCRLSSAWPQPQDSIYT
jgi:pyruvate dehydrogenase (quinone)